MPDTQARVVWTIDNDDVESLLIREALLRAFPDCVVVPLTDAAAARAALVDASVARPNLVLLNYFLPTCEAPTLLPALREALGWTPIVVLSALADKSDVQRCLSAQASLFVEKPSSYVGLSTTLARLCDVYLDIARFP